MALNPHLQELVDNQKLSFEDVFELYAALVVEHFKEVTNDIIADVGVAEYVRTAGDITVDRMASDCRDWANNIIPEMVGDNLPGNTQKGPGQSWLWFCIQEKINAYIDETKSFQVKVL